MKSEFEEYRETGMLGTYSPDRALIRKMSDGGVVTVFRDTFHCAEENHFVREREMLIGGKRFVISSMFPKEPTATVTEKMLSLIDTDIGKDMENS